MITAISERIVSKLLASQLIEEDDTDLFCYGLFITISNLFCLFETVLFGLFLKVLLESLVFYILFFPLRRYAGGVHARKEITCTFCTTFAILFSMYGIRIMENSRGYSVYMICITVGTLAVFLLSPLDTPEKPLGQEDYHHYKKISISLALGIDIMAFLSYSMNMYGVCAASSVSILLEGLLLIAGKIKGGMMVSAENP